MKSHFRFQGRHKWRRDGQYQNPVTKDWMERYICKKCHVRAVVKSGQKPKASCNCAEDWIRQLMVS